MGPTCGVGRGVVKRHGKRSGGKRAEDCSGGLWRGRAWMDGLGWLCKGRQVWGEASAVTEAPQLLCSMTSFCWCGIIVLALYRLS